MKTTKQLGRSLNRARKSLRGAGKRARGFRKSAMAGAAGAVLLLGKLGSAVKQGASDFTERSFPQKKKTKEVFEVKKSTVVALLVALAAVAGVLGALYFYVLRREKELDEYEQLLFSEDFNDDPPEDDDEPAPDAEPAQA